MGDEENTKRKRNLPKYLSDYVGVPGQNSDKSESTSVTSSSRHSNKQGSRTRKNTSTMLRGRARQAAREANLAKLKVEQHKDKSRLEVEIVAQKAELHAQLKIKEAQLQADWKEKEAMLLQDEASEDEIVDCLKDFDELVENAAGAENKAKTEPKLENIKKEDAPEQDTKFRVKEWLEKINPKQEPADDEPRNKIRQSAKEKGMVGDWTAFGKPPFLSSLPKINLPVFDGDPCHWPNWYGMFKALVHDQKLSKTQKMIHLKASVKGSAEKAIAGMFFDGTMYEEAIKELKHRFGNPELISKSLIRKLLDLPTLRDENVLSLRSFVDNLHNIVRTLKTYGHGADVQAAANMQQGMERLPPRIAEGWSRQKIQLKPKKVDLSDLDRWLETEVQVKEMAYGGTSEPEKPNHEGGKSKANASSSRWQARRQNGRASTFATSGGKLECAVCKGDHQITVSETWKRATVNDRWELAKKHNLCFLCLKRNHRTWRCSSKDPCTVEGCGRRHHPELHKTEEILRLNPSADTFSPAQAAEENAQQTGMPTTYATCGAIEQPDTVRRTGKVAL